MLQPFFGEGVGVGVSQIAQKHKMHRSRGVELNEKVSLHTFRYDKTSSASGRNAIQAPMWLIRQLNWVQAPCLIC